MGKPSVAIAGAGIMGRVLALALQREGWAVTLFDRDPVEGGGAAAYTAAGMLAPYSELESADSEIYRLGLRSLALWPALVSAIGATELFHARGSLVVAHGQDAADLAHFRQLLQHKLPDAPGIVPLDRAGLAQREPELAAQFGSALYLAEEAWLYNGELMQALAQHLRARGARWFAGCEVQSLHEQGVVAAGREHRFDRVVDCRGLGAKPDMAGLRGVRGEVIHVHAPEVNLRHMVRLMHPRYRLYLVPRENHHYLLGATQIESEDMSEISVRSALELLSALYAIQPAFAEARIVETRTNCRPALLDNQPRLAWSDGVLQVNGLFRHGFLLAPALAELALAELGGTQAAARVAAAAPMN